MVDRNLLRQRLAEAEGALHKLLTGGATVQLSYQGESVTFSLADEGRLRRYIAELRAQLGFGHSRTRARSVIFG